MSKGQATRQTILSQAVRTASLVGLEGLSIGRLATELSLSKSGLFAHFQSKEALQISVLTQAAEEFAQEVVRPALAMPRGLPRLSSLFDRWVSWGLRNDGPKGCIFIAAAAELDDQRGPVRDHLVKLQKDWIATVRRVYDGCVQSGEFARGHDSQAFAQELYGQVLALSFFSRLLEIPSTRDRASQAFAALIERHKQKP